MLKAGGEEGMGLDAAATDEETSSPAPRDLLRPERGAAPRLAEDGLGLRGELRLHRVRELLQSRNSNYQGSNAQREFCKHTSSCIRVLFPSLCLALGVKNSVMQKRGFRRGLGIEVGLESRVGSKHKRAKRASKEKITLRAHASTRLIDS